MYSNYWKAYFKNDFIDKIKPLKIEEYKRYRRKTVCPATINRELNSLSKMFSVAKENGYLLVNPRHSVKKLRVENKKIRFLTREEEKLMFDKN